MKDVSTAAAEKTPMPAAITGPLEIARAISGSMPLSRPVCTASSVPFHITNMISGMALPTTMACWIFLRSPSRDAQMVGTTLWKLRPWSMIGMHAAPPDQLATALGPNSALGSACGTVKRRSPKKAMMTTAVSRLLTCSTMSEPLLTAMNPPQTAVNRMDPAWALMPGMTETTISPPRETNAVSVAMWKKRYITVVRFAVLGPAVIDAMVIIDVVRWPVFAIVSRATSATRSPVKTR
mmetsp:Transcript_8704/g.25660  ORF Transcript_8704/g.25660 Transcript_8704/m.25660 type:complete len:237 (+) Transcript_8704:214-924(+)